jgi:putative copper resistance protein D
MGLELTSWEFSTLITRWLLYVGVAGSVGGACSLYLLKAYRGLQGALLKYAFFAVLLAITSAFGHFFVRVGAVLEEGVSGMFEPDIVSILWNSAVGEALLLRVLGLFLLLVALVLLWHKRRLTATWVEPGTRVAWLGFSGLLLTAASYTEAGHAVSQSWIFQFALVVHLSLTAWWMGTLYPLWLACHRLASAEAHAVLHRFGQFAVAAVLLVVLAGLYLSYQLTAWNNLFTSSYGLFLITKLILVLLLLGLAALHKFVLVPQLLSSQAASRLKKSLLIEKYVGAGIYAITTVLTTLVGPMM